MKYKITQGEIIEKWMEIIQQSDTGGESVISAVRLARWVEKRLLTSDETSTMDKAYQEMKELWW